MNPIQEISDRLSRIEAKLDQLLGTPANLEQANTTSLPRVWVLCDYPALEPVSPLTWVPLPWPQGPVKAGPRALDPEEIETEMAGIPEYQDEDQLDPEVQEAMGLACQWPEEYGPETQVQTSQEPKLATPRTPRVAKSQEPKTQEPKPKEPKTQEPKTQEPKTIASQVVQGYRIRHLEPKVRAALVAEVGSRVTDGKRVGTIKETGGRGIKVLWDSGLRGKWFSEGISLVS